MKVQQVEQQTGQRAASRSVFARIGEAKIEGERQRLAKMTPEQRTRDYSLQKVVSGIFTFFGALLTLGLLVDLFVAYAAFRIPLVILLGLFFWLTYRQTRRKK